MLNYVVEIKVYYGNGGHDVWKENVKAYNVDNANEIVNNRINYLNENNYECNVYYVNRVYKA